MEPTDIEVWSPYLASLKDLMETAWQRCGGGDTRWQDRKSEQSRGQLIPFYSLFPFTPFMGTGDNASPRLCPISHLSPSRHYSQRFCYHAGDQPPKEPSLKDNVTGPWIVEMEALSLWGWTSETSPSPFRCSRWIGCFSRLYEDFCCF